jgi:hypothetical protein
MGGAGIRTPGMKGGGNAGNTTRTRRNNSISGQSQPPHVHHGHQRGHYPPIRSRRSSFRVLGARRRAMDTGCLLVRGSSTRRRTIRIRSLRPIHPSTHTRFTRFSVVTVVSGGAYSNGSSHLPTSYPGDPGGGGYGGGHSSFNEYANHPGSLPKQIWMDHHQQHHHHYQLGGQPRSVAWTGVCCRVLMVRSFFLSFFFFYYWLHLDLTNS